MSYRDFHFLGVSRKRRRTWSCHADVWMRSPRRCRVLPRVRPKPSLLPSGGAVLHKVRPYSGCFRGRYYRRYRGRYRGRNQSSVINHHLLLFLFHFYRTLLRLLWSLAIQGAANYFVLIRHMHPDYLISIFSMSLIRLCLHN